MKATANGLYGFLEQRIPKELSCDWDNDGRMVVPDGDKPIQKVLITLDVTESAIDYAANNGFDCIISHHPILFNPIKKGVDVVVHSASKYISGQGLSVAGAIVAGE